MKMEKKMAIATKNCHFLPVRDKQGLSIHPPLCTHACACVCACMLNNSASVNFQVLLQEKKLNMLEINIAAWSHVEAGS